MAIGKLVMEAEMNHDDRLADLMRRNAELLARVDATLSAPRAIGEPWPRAADVTQSVRKVTEADPAAQPQPPAELPRLRARVAALEQYRDALETALAASIGRLVERDTALERRLAALEAGDVQDAEPRLRLIEDAS
ncbi:MAG: hypothetical protein U1G05_00070 [Kiritimatiellia bacterium]